MNISQFSQSFSIYQLLSKQFKRQSQYTKQIKDEEFQYTLLSSNFQLNQFVKNSTFYNSKISEKQDQFQSQSMSFKQNIQEILDIQRLDQLQLKWNFCCNNFKLKKQYSCILTKYNQLILKPCNNNGIEYYFNFNTVLCQVKSSQLQQNQMIFKCGNIILQFSKLDNRLKLYTWFKLLKQKIQNSQGHHYKLKFLYEISNFYEKKYKLERQFCKQCNTGDIILFQGYSFQSKLLRFFTNSSYDHVAMIVKDSFQNIFLYQSNSTNGVSMIPWTIFLSKKIFKNIQKIAWRKLQDIKRSFQFIAIVHQFIKQNAKTNYYISMGKLMCSHSYISKNEQEQGYFCSELIAKIYKKLGLLPIQYQQNNYKPSSSFLPYHFSQKYNLHLQKGFLSNQYQILFFQQLLTQK